MSNDLLTAQESARRLGITTASLYAWLAASNAGTLLIRGQPAVIDYLQGGPKGQGRIRIEPQEIERLKELMRVRPRRAVLPCPRAPREHYPGITVRLGRPSGQTCLPGGGARETTPTTPPANE